MFGEYMSGLVVWRFEMNVLMDWMTGTVSGIERRSCEKKTARVPGRRL